MAVTLSTALTNVRMILDEVNAQFWTDAQLTVWLNEACADSQRRCEWKQKNSSVAVTSGTQNYSAPADVLRIHKVTFQATGSINTYTLEYRGLMEMDQIWGINQQWPAAYPLYYTLWGQPGTATLQIQTYPVPAQNGALAVFYYPDIVAAAAGSDNMDILQGYEDMMYDYCMYRALRKDADPRWQEAKADYEEKIIAMVNTSRTYQDQAGTFATGQQALPQWLTSSEGW